jgi:hypothetical protein
MIRHVPAPKLLGFGVLGFGFLVLGSFGFGCFGVWVSFGFGGFGIWIVLGFWFWFSLAIIVTKQFIALRKLHIM